MPSSYDVALKCFIIFFRSLLSANVFCKSPLNFGKKTFLAFKFRFFSIIFIKSVILISFEFPILNILKLEMLSFGP